MTTAKTKTFTLLIDCDDRYAVDTAYGRLYATDEPALVRAIRFVFDVRCVRFTDRRLIDSRATPRRPIPLAHYGIAS